MPDNLTNFLPALKIPFIGRINRIKNDNNALWTMIPKDTGGGGGPTRDGSAAFSTSDIGEKFSVHLGRSGAGGYQALEGSFPTAGNQRYKQGFRQGRTAYWPARISLAAVERTKRDIDAFAKIMIEAAVQVGTDLKNDDERILLNDGSGTLGIAGTVPACSGNQLVVPLDNFQDARKFAVGQYLNVWSARTVGATQLTGVLTGTGTQYIVEVLAVTVSGSTASITLRTLNGTGTWLTTDIVAGHVFTKANDQETTTIAAGTAYTAARTANVRNEPMGLLGICLDCDTPMETGATAGGLFGINAPTQYAYMNTATAGAAVVGGEAAWTAYNSRSATARGINNLILQSLRDMPDIAVGETPTHYITTYGGRMEFVNTLTGIRRNVNTTSVQGSQGGGFKENLKGGSYPEYDDTPVIPHRYAPSYRMTPGSTAVPLAATYLAVNMNYITAREWNPIHFWDLDGREWRMFERKPFIEAILGHTWELTTEKRAAHAAAHAILATDFS